MNFTVSLSPEGLNVSQLQAFEQKINLMAEVQTSTLKRCQEVFDNLKAEIADQDERIRILNTPERRVLKSMLDWYQLRCDAQEKQIHELEEELRSIRSGIENLTKKPTKKNARPSH